MESNKETNNVRDEILESIHDKKKKLINVYAGPGSGKSTLIAEIINKYLTETDYGLNNFLCLSYTNESWKELLDKIAQKCDLIMNFDHLNITTFHKYCASLILKENELENKTGEDLKNNLRNELTDEELKKLSNEEIEEYKKKAIDDLIEDATNELDVYHYSNGERGAINKNLLTEKKVLFLDEAQDLKEDTYRFLESLLRASKNKIKVYAFSDPDQGIFEYGGSNHKFISYLLEKGKNYELTENHRSCEKLVEFTEKYRKDSFESPRKQDMISASGKKGVKDSIKYIKVSENNYCNAILQSVKSHISELKKDCTIGVIVPKGVEAHNIYASLTHEYISSANISVKTTGMSYTSFNLCRLDEFHSLFRALYETFARKKHTCASLLCIFDYDLNNALKEFKNNYETSKYCNATIDFFNDFRTQYKNYYSTSNNNPKRILIEEGKFFVSELEAFMRYSSSYTFDEFYNDYVEKLPVKNDKPQIDITVSTIHKAKGHEYDTVFMACLEKEKNWLSMRYDNEKGPGFEKCRYVAMTRAKSKLYIFNDKVEKYYFDSNFVDMTDLKEKKEESIFLSPHDVTLSFSQYNKLVYYEKGKTESFTQFIPYKYEINIEDKNYSMGIDDKTCGMFPDTPSWLQAGSKLHLQNVMAASENNRFEFFADLTRGSLCYVERISKRCWSSAKESLDDSVLSRIINEFEKYKNNYLSNQTDSQKHLLEGQREYKINKPFEDWCNKHLDIEIGAVVVINSVSAPWTKFNQGKYKEERSQHYEYYNKDGSLKVDNLLNDINEARYVKENHQKKTYYSFTKNDSSFGCSPINIETMISNGEKDILVTKKINKLLDLKIKFFSDTKIQKELKEKYPNEWDQCEKLVLDELKSKAIENEEKYGFSRKVILPIIKFKEEQ